MERESNIPSQCQVREIAAVVAAVIYSIERQPRLVFIPEAYAGVSYFSEHDWWYFQAISDNRTCWSCNEWDKTTFTGDELLSVFPYLEIGDENTILAYVHPHCRCILIRISDPLSYLGLDLGVSPDWMPGSDNILA